MKQFFSFRFVAACVAWLLLGSVKATSQTISGNLSVCLGASRTVLTISTTGGVWSSGDVTKATINATTGEVTGVAAGTATMSYTIPPSTVFTAVVTVNPYVMSPIGYSSMYGVRCRGGIPATCTVHPMWGNDWTSSDPSIATINTSGIVIPSAINLGTTTITYRHGYGACDVTTVVTVSETPTVSIVTAMCNGTTQTVTALPAGGTWTSSNLSVGTIGSTSGALSGFTGGSTNIRYRSPMGCETLTNVTVMPIPAIIHGTTLFCAGNTSSLYSPTPGGSWSSDNPSVATINASTGVVAGVSPGTALISYTMSTGCARTVVVTVQAAISAITGEDFVCVGQSISLSNATPGGTWVSSSTAKATVTTYTGLVVGMGAGTVNITYRRSGGCYTTKTLTVNSTMTGITGGTQVCVGSVLALGHASPGGTWSASNANATIDPTTGEATGVTPGAVGITYTLGPGCIKTMPLIVKVNPGAITGATTVCAGSWTYLGNPTPGGTWSSSDPSIATAGSTSGLVTGVSEGTTTITYRVTLSGCMTTRVQSVTPLPGAITGTSTVCVGSTSALSSTPTGGTWASSNTYAATVGSSSGIVSATAPGTSRITYTLPTGCRGSTVITINASPAAITGTLSVCPGATTSLYCASTGGAWSSSAPSVASVTSTGLVTGGTAGNATISYTFSNGCYRTAEVTVNPDAATGSITGATEICLGSSTTLGNSVSGGVWASSDTSVATVDSATGEVSGITLGSATITYTVTTPCGSAFAVKGVSVITVPATPTITGLSLIGAGGTVSFAASAAGGVWTSSDVSVATIDTDGVASGVAPGATVISYVLNNSCGSVFDTAILTVTGDTLAAAAWGTYYGGTQNEYGYGVATDSYGNVYLSGTTGSPTGIASEGAYQETHQGGMDAFLVKFNSAGVRQWGTYYGGRFSGGPGNDYGKAVTVDDDGNVYLAGYTECNTGIATGGAHQSGYGGSNDAFLVKFNSSGVRQWATYYGGTSGDNAAAIATDVDGNVYLAGGTASSANIGTPAGHKPALGTGVNDAFLVKFNSSGVRQWGTYYGGAQTEYGYAVATDASGNVILTGYADSDTGIATGGAHQSTNGTGGDAFIAKFSGSGTRLWGTYFGGTGQDEGHSVAVDADGSLIIAGLTMSSASIATGGAHQTVYAGGFDAFLAKFTSGGSLLWATYYGGTGNDFGYGVSLDTSGNAYLVGSTGSASGISTAGSRQPSIGGGSDVFVTKLNGAGVRQWSTYHGGGANEDGYGISVDPFGYVFFCGSAGSTTAISFGTPHQVDFGGNTADAFLVRFAPCIAGDAGSISGPGIVGVDATIALIPTVGGGSWSTADPGVATVDGGGVVTGIAPGTVSVSYTVSGDCGTDVATHEVAVVAAKPFMNIGGGEMLHIFPNPTAGAITLKIPANGTVFICTIDGRELQHLSVSAGSNKLNMPAGIAEGIYLLHYRGDDGSSEVVRLVYRP